MGFKLIQKDDTFYPADYSLGVDDEINLILVGGGGSVPGALDTQYSLYPYEAGGNMVCCCGYRSHFLPSATFFGGSLSALGGANFDKKSGFADGNTDAGYVNASPYSYASGGGGGWLPGVQESGGNGGLPDRTGSGTLPGAPGLAGEGTSVAQAQRVIKNTFGGKFFCSGDTLNAKPIPAIGIAKAQDLNKIPTGNSYRTGGGAGAGFGAGAGGAAARTNAGGSIGVGSGSGAQILNASYRITAEDVANGIPITIGRHGKTYRSRYTTQDIPTGDAYNSAWYYAANYASPSTAPFIFGKQGAHNGTAPYINIAGKKAICQNGNAVLYASGSNSVAYVPDITTGITYYLTANAGKAVYSIRCINSTWIICCEGGYVYYSTDPLGTWSSTQVGTNAIWDVAFYSNKYVFINSNYTATNGHIYTSDTLAGTKTASTSFAYGTSYSYQWPNSFVQLKVIDGALWIIDFIEYGSNNCTYFLAFRCVTLGTWTKISESAITCNGHAGSGQVFDIFGVDIIVCGQYWSGSNSYALHLRISGSTVSTIKGNGRISGKQARDLYGTNYMPVVIGSTLAFIPCSLAGTAPTVQSYSGYGILTVPLSGTWGSGADWFDQAGAIVSYNMFKKVGWAFGNLLAVLGTKMYCGLALGMGDCSMDLADLYATYPESFLVNGNYDCSQAYQEELTSDKSILSGADGCCTIFW